MKKNDFSDPAAASALTESIHRLAAQLPVVRLMEVCGTHTMEIGRLGIRHLLPANIELISGPGCPVCVTPASYIDAAAALAMANRRLRIVTFGDLFRVPGNRSSFAQAKARGAAIDIASTPRIALEIARNHPGEEVIFTAVGFETTAPATAAAVLAGVAEKLDNLTFLVAHRLVPPALDALVADPSLRIAGFLLPGHVSAIIGADAYGTLVNHGIPGVVTGFEPLDILAGICMLLDLIVRQEVRIKNAYTRIVTPQGNEMALRLIGKVYEPCHAMWRGIGAFPESGLKLRSEYAACDAAIRFGLADDEAEMPEGCACGGVLVGRIRPDECPLFATACTPDHPGGPCMVSSEGACAAAFKYGCRP